MLFYLAGLQMEEFMAKYPEAGASTGARKSALETVENNIKWAEKHLGQVVSWFESNVKDEASSNSAECPQDQ